MLRFSLLSLSLLINLSILFAENHPAGPEETSPKNLKVSGSVIDISTGEVLTGVKVSIPGIAEVYTDFEGKFEFTGLKPGEYNIICNMVTYQTGMIDTISINYSVTEQHVILKLKPITEKPVIQKYIPAASELAQNVG